MGASDQSKQVDDGIAYSHDREQVLKGIQPKHQVMYKTFKFCRLMAIMLVVVGGIFFGLTFVSIFNFITRFKIYRYANLGLFGIAILFALLAVAIRLVFLRKAPFDEWVYEIAEKRLGTSIIFYDSKYIYINYDRGGKEVDKKEFVTEMSDKSIHYSYYYIKTFIDQGVIMVECKRRQPIPDRASFTPNDDKFWNIVPMGLCINEETQKVSPVGWYINDNNKNKELRYTVPSTSILICGGTGCLGEDEYVLMHDTLVH